MPTPAMPGSPANCAGTMLRNAASPHAATSNPASAAGERHHQAFGQHLLDDARARRADRAPDRHFFLPAGGARQQQRRDVRARDEHHERDRAEQHEQRRPHVADQRIAQRPQVRGVVGVFRRIGSQTAVRR